MVSDSTVCFLLFSKYWLASWNVDFIVRNRLNGQKVIFGQLDVVCSIGSLIDRLQSVKVVCSCVTLFKVAEKYISSFGTIAERRTRYEMS